MVMQDLRKFRREEGGLVLVEAMLTFPIVILMMVAMIEVGMAVFQWNLTVKALQVGARLAAVSDPIVGATAYATLDDDFGQPFPDSTPRVPGDPVPANIRKVSCGAGAASCDVAALARVMTGGDTCGSTTVGGPSGICDVAIFIRPENLRFTYYRAGLGYVGRPFGTVTNITVELRNQYFDFLFLDRLIPIAGRIRIPSHPVSITSEDISDCIDVCP